MNFTGVMQSGEEFAAGDERRLNLLARSGI
jgi:hypothetical protein